MQRCIIDGIEYIGICSEKKNKFKHIKEYQINTIWKLEEGFEDILTVISVSVEKEKLDFNIIDNKKGQNISGEICHEKSLVIEVTYKIKLKYSSFKNNNSIFIYKFSQNIFLNANIPSKIGGENIIDLKRIGKIKIEECLVDMYINNIEKRCFELNLGGVILLEEII
ncbi:hypothetical protein [uncultured Clostridium sp.]|jgi:hypothetical protein|uniref:hypothetical protein n=1 Tax=uncultured Clostridium sp. TaxID=59620 RepID=UPI002602231C|nr:hypothetical protein [uncultured Clostridium sp.]